MKWLTKLPFNHLDLNFDFSMHTWMFMCIFIGLLEVIIELLFIHTRVLASWNQDKLLSWRVHLWNCNSGVGNIQGCIKTFCTYNTCQKSMHSMDLIEAWKCGKKLTSSFGKSMFTNCIHALNQLTLVVIYIFFIFLRTVWTFITIFSELMDEYEVASMKLATS